MKRNRAGVRREENKIKPTFLTPMRKGHRPEIFADLRAESTLPLVNRCGSVSLHRGCHPGGVTERKIVACERRKERRQNGRWRKENEVGRHGSFYLVFSSGTFQKFSTNSNYSHFFFRKWEKMGKKFYLVHWLVIRTTRSTRHILKVRTFILQTLNNTSTHTSQLQKSDSEVRVGWRRSC